MSEGSSREPKPGRDVQSRWFVPVLAGLVHSVLMVLAAPPFDQWYLAFVALVPLLWLAQRGSQRPWRDGWLLMLGVLPMWLVWEYWMYKVTAPGFPFFVLLQCSWVALWWWGTRRVQRLLPRVPLWVVAPLTWVAVEFFRGEIFLSGYAFGLLPYPLVKLPLMAAPAAWGGVYFVSFMVAMVNAALWERVRVALRPTERAADGKRIAPQGRIATVSVLVALAVTWGAAAGLSGRYVPGRQPGTTAVTVRPGILQTNLPQDNKLHWGIERSIQDWRRFEQLTREMAGSEPRPDFILWPETMMPGETLERQAMQALMNAGIGFRLPDRTMLPADEFYVALLQLQRSIGVPMLVGEDALLNMKVQTLPDGRIDTSWDARYNSAYLVEFGEVAPIRYDKMRLTPFGETMPVISRWPWLQDWMLNWGVGAQGLTFDLNAGQQYTVFPIGPAKIVTPICFETTVGDLCRELVFREGERRANFIANLTNDGWFNHSDIAREQHLQIAQWRCVELATPMARAANTGISCLIDAQGRVLRRGVDGSLQESKVDGILKGEVALGTATTPYAHVGNIFGWVVLWGAAVGVVGSFLRGRRKAVGVAAAAPANKGH